MGVLDFEAYAKCKMEISEQQKVIDHLLKIVEELEEKVNAVYGAYQTLQYTCQGQCNIYTTEIEKLRKNIEMLEDALAKKPE